MTYESYSYIRDLIEADIRELERHFQMACRFIPYEYVNSGKSGVEKAHNIFSKRLLEINKAKDGLHVAAANMHKDHPNPEMRKFWGLE